MPTNDDLVVRVNADKKPQKAAKPVDLFAHMKALAEQKKQLAELRKMYGMFQVYRNPKRTDYTKKEKQLPEMPS